MTNVPHTQRVDLSTTLHQLDTLGKIADSKKAYIKVDRQSLLNLLMDHGKLVATVSRYVKVIEPSNRVKLLR